MRKDNKGKDGRPEPEKKKEDVVNVLFSKY